MAIFVATDYKITLNGTNLSPYLTHAELKISANDVTTTSFGGSYVTRVAGLKEGSISLTFNQDFASAAVDATIYPLIGSLGTVVIYPTSSAVGTGNPAYTAVASIIDYSPFASNIGDLATFSVTWPTSGTISRATA
jgi:hypothetical protein